MERLVAASACSNGYLLSSCLFFMPTQPLFVCSLADTDLYLEEQEGWLVKKGSNIATSRQLQGQTSLLWLPLLERNFAAFQEQIEVGLPFGAEERARIVATFPVTDLVLLGLQSTSSYWIGLALAWVPYNAPNTRVAQQLLLLSQDQALPQNLRHQTKRYYFT